MSSAACGGRLPLPGAGVSVGVLAIDFRGFQGQEGGQRPASPQVHGWAVCRLPGVGVYSWGCGHMGGVSRGFPGVLRQ